MAKKNADIEVTTYTDDRVEISTVNKEIAVKFLALVDDLISKAYTNKDYEKLEEYSKTYTSIERQMTKVFSKMEEDANE